MQLVATVVDPLGRMSVSQLAAVIGLTLAAFFTLAVVANVLRQLLFKNPNEPPLVFHWVPVIGSTIEYGIDPYKFFFKCQEKYGDTFTFILLGKKATVCLGTKGNDFILNGKLKDVCAEEVYTPLCTPVFGKDVVYDCPNSKLMEQKKFVKFGLTSDALRSYVRLITSEVETYIATSPNFAGPRGTVNVPKAMSEITIFTASRSLQGKEVRARFDASFAALYHDLDAGFSPINFMLPRWPLPHNTARDRAHRRIVDVYLDIIRTRRAAGEGTAGGDEKGAARPDDEHDMIGNLMKCRYKDGTPVPDHEVAHMMIALLMAGQHSSSSTISWMVLRLATRPRVIEELLDEQRRALGAHLPALEHEDLARLPLHAQIIKETLRLHAPIHSIMRAVKQPLPVEGTAFVVPVSHWLMAAPGVTARSADHFADPATWDPHRWDVSAGDAAAAASAATAEEEKVDYGYGMVSKGAGSPYLPFGAGRHRCIGEQFAHVQLSTILVALVRAFKWRALDGQKDVVATDYSSLFSRPLQPAFIQWERRQPETSEKS